MRRRRIQNIRTMNGIVVQNFNYGDRYLLQLVGRRDGSSLFGSNNRWKNFYGISGAWRISEDFNDSRLPGAQDSRGRGTAGLRPGFEYQYETYSVFVRHDLEEHDRQQEPRAGASDRERSRHQRELPRPLRPRVREVGSSHRRCIPARSAFARAVGWIHGAVAERSASRWTYDGRIAQCARHRRQEPELQLDAHG